MTKTSASSQSSSLVYNGFGGSQRKENFIGFPRGQSRTNPAGRGLSMSMSLGSAKSVLSPK